MTGHEFYKVFAGRAAVLFIMMVLVLNVAQLVYVDGRDRKWSTAAYNEAWEDVGAVLDGDCGRRREAFDLWFEEHVMALIGAASDEEESEAAAYTGDVYKERQLLDRIKTEAYSAFGYNEYLDSVGAAAGKYEMLAVFSDSDGFAHRDIIKMKEAYGRISDKELFPAASAGIRMATKSDITDLLSIVLFLYLATSVWLKEKEQSMLVLIRTTYRGRVRLAFSKLMVLMASCVFAGLLLYGSNMVTAGVVYGLGDLERPLAAVYEYSHTLWEISVGEFLVYSLVFKVLAFTFIMMLISLICVIAGSAVEAFAWISAVSAAGCLMYYKIPALSVWSPFKYLNPFAMLKTECLFEGYKSISVFGYPIMYGYCLAVLAAAGYAVFCVITIRCFVRNVIKGRHKELMVVLCIRGMVNKLQGRMAMHTGMLRHEAYRIFVCHSAWVVAAVFALFIIYSGRPYEVRYINYKEYQVERYFLKLQGEVTPEKLSFIEDERKRVAELSGDEREAGLYALDKVEKRVKYLEENKGAYFIYDVPHNLLTAANVGSVTDFIRAVVCLIPVALIFPCFFAPDLQNGVNRLTDVTMYGRRRLRRLRYVSGAVLAVIIAVAAHVTYFVQVMVSYGVDREVLSYPVCSLPQLSGFGCGMSLGTYYIIIYLLKTASAVAGAFFIYGISRLLKSPAYTILASFIVLIVPFLAAMYERRLIYAAYPYSMALGNLFVQNKAAAVTCMASVVLVAVIMCVAGRIKAGKR